ncbi:hypothetical protein N407_08475 [Helicobacter pylori FD662]|nr:hypothetical protein N407_08475 [Helicobacter pylori FD662]
MQFLGVFYKEWLLSLSFKRESFNFSGFLAGLS